MRLIASGTVEGRVLSGRSFVLLSVRRFRVAVWSRFTVLGERMFGGAFAFFGSRSRAVWGCWEGMTLVTLSDVCGSYERIQR